MKNNLYQKDLISVDSLDAATVKNIFQKADEMRKIVQTERHADILKGFIMAALFYEPSSRTFSSFITAMQRLGGGIIPLNGMANTSMAKGETLEDTARVFSSYADVIVVRFPQIGSAKIVADDSPVPVINAGDGPGEHPTQALLDTYTIRKHFNNFDGLTVGLIGDLLYGRTVHSLVKLLSILGVKKFIFISPAKLKMPPGIGNKIRAIGGSIRETEYLKEAVGDLDVMYCTRVQKERFTDLAEYEKLKHTYVITPQIMKSAKKKMVLMHPLPRVGEIDPSVDCDERAIYFREQLVNGLYVRMALLSLILIS